MRFFQSSTKPRQLWHMLTPKDRGLVVVAMAATGMLWFAGVSPVETLLLALLAGSAVVIALCDLRHRIIPDLISLPLVPAGIGLAASQGHEVLLAHAATAAVAAAQTGASPTMKCAKPKISTNESVISVAELRISSGLRRIQPRTRRVREGLRDGEAIATMNPV